MKYTAAHVLRKARVDLMLHELPDAVIRFLKLY